MIATLRKDGRLYTRVYNDEDVCRCLNNGVEIFLTSDHVNEVRDALKQGADS